MQGLYKLTGSASKLAALSNYSRACKLADRISRREAVVPLPDRAGHKTIDRISRQIVVALGEQYYPQFPDLFYKELEEGRGESGE